jgi:hypothetical protein
MFFTTPSMIWPFLQACISSPAARRGLLEHGAAGDDDVAAGAVHLQDLEGLRRPSAA